MVVLALFIVAVVSLISLISGVSLIFFAFIRKKKSKRDFIIILISGLLTLFPAECTTYKYIRGEIESKRLEQQEKGPLISAIEHNNLDEIKSLIDNGSDVNQVRRFVCESYYRFHTPLSYAASLNNEKLVKYFLANKAEPDFNMIYKMSDEEYASWTPLMYATTNNNFKIIDLLLNKGADINKGDFSDTPFTLALKNGNLELVKKIYDNGASNKVKHLRSTKSLIFILVEENPDISILNYLYHNNIDTDLNYYDDTTPFLESIKKNNPNDFTFELYKLGADIYANDQWNMNALYYAGKNNNFKMVKFLVEHEVSLHQKNYRGETPFFHIATAFCYDEKFEVRMKILDFLIEQEADYTSKDKYQMSVIERCQDWDRSTEYINELKKVLEI